MGYHSALLEGTFRFVNFLYSDDKQQQLIDGRENVDHTRSWQSASPNRCLCTLSIDRRVSFYDPKQMHQQRSEDWFFLTAFHYVDHQETPASSEKSAATRVAEQIQGRQF